MFFGKTSQTIKRILIVEDEPLLAFDHEHGLMLGGFHVVATMDRARQAKAFIESGAEVDLLVTDVHLRGPGTGVDLAMAARARGVSVLFAATGHPPANMTTDLAMGWLAKPFVPRDLVRAVNACDKLMRGQAPGRIPVRLTLFPTIT